MRFLQRLNRNIRRLQNDFCQFGQEGQSSGVSPGRPITSNVRLLMRDLFGNDVDDAGEVEKYLAEMDNETIEARAANLKYIISIVPEHGLMMPHESFLVFTEARDAFVNGLYVSTIMLAQALIEHRLQIFMSSIGEYHAANRGVNAIIKRLQIIRPQHAFILERVERLRAFRNPFAHLKPFEHEHTIGQVSLRTRQHPNEVLYHRAKEALALMYTIATMDFK